jgi:hypothetical protein
MARIRSIKPDFWTSEQIMECSLNARLLFIGMWNFADDLGRIPFSVKSIKASVLPGDDISLDTIRGMIAELSKNGLVLTYEVDGREYLQITGWHHQRIDKPQAGKCPSPVNGYSKNVPRTIPPDRIGEDRIGEDRKEVARESAPSSDFEFEDFWNLWPNKVGKPAALKAFVSARKRADLDAIVAGVFAYIRDKPPDRPWLNPATFLNQNRWEDQPAQVANGKPKNAIIQAADDLCRKLASFDGPPREVDGVRSGAGETTPRLLSHG